MITSIEIKKCHCLNLCLCHLQKTNDLYKFLLSCSLRRGLYSKKNLVSSVIAICDKYDFSLARILTDKSYFSSCRTTMKSRSECGISDSVKHALSSHSLSIVNNLLAAF